MVDLSSSQTVKVYQAGYLKYHVGISGWISSRKRTNKLETRILLIRVMLHDVLGKTSAWNMDDMLLSQRSDDVDWDSSC